MLVALEKSEEKQYGKYGEGVDKDVWFCVNREQTKGRQKLSFSRVQ